MQTADFFRSRIDAMIKLNDPLTVLAQRLPWDLIEASVAAKFERRNRAGQTLDGADLFGPTAVCDPTQIGRFRRALGEDGLEQLLKASIDTAVAIKAVKPAELERVIVDTTVQEKAIAQAVDGRLLEIAPQGRRCRQARRHSAQADLRQRGQGTAAQGRRLHAKQFRRLNAGRGG